MRALLAGAVRKRGVVPQGPLMLKARSVMVSSLKKINSFLSDATSQPVLLRNTARPTSGEYIFQRLGLTQTFEWIAHYGFDQI